MLVLPGINFGSSGVRNEQESNDHASPRHGKRILGAVASVWQAGRTYTTFARTRYPQGSSFQKELEQRWQGSRKSAFHSVCNQLTEESMAEHSLAPGLLLAMPQMTDPNFARSVVLLCRHESDGAMGLVVNRPTDTLVASVVQFDPPLTEDRAGLRVWTGGPVEQQRAWLLLGFDPGEDDALPIAPGLYLSASARVLRHILEGGDEDRVREARFLVGYAGWAGGQLESELAASAWLTADVSKDLIFHTDAEVMWEAAIRSLGIDPYALQLGTGVH